MQHVKEDFQSTLVDGIIHRTSDLQNLVKKVRPKDRADDDTTVSEEVLPKVDSWERKKATKAILRSFDQFLIDAHRALRHITRSKKFERRHQLPQESTPLN
ncbi:interleukin-6-like [Sardina pilchardus]|uniref:interleukin-6-like n=1 Tax=Sardina pilchardus TaxID=27697 RepID=UPI002E1526E5